MDEIDQAQCLSQDFVDRAIEANRKGLQLTPRQRCYNCDEPVEGEKLFCCSECQEDWQYRMTRLRGYQVFSGAS